MIRIKIDYKLELMDSVTEFLDSLLDAKYRFDLDNISDIESTDDLRVAIADKLNIDPATVEVTLLGQYKLEYVELQGKSSILYFNTEKEARKLYDKYIDEAKRAYGNMSVNAAERSTLHTVIKKMTLGKVDIQGNCSDISSVRTVVEEY